MFLWCSLVFLLKGILIIWLLLEILSDHKMELTIWPQQPSEIAFMFLLHSAHIKLFFCSSQTFLRLWMPPWFSSLTDRVLLEFYFLLFLHANLFLSYTFIFWQLFLLLFLNSTLDRVRSFVKFMQTVVTRSKTTSTQ